MNIPRALPSIAQTSQSKCSIVLPNNEHAGTGVAEG
jgi:hypothetical protein